MWSSDSGVTEFTVILSKHYMCFIYMIKPVRVTFTPTINNQAAQRWTVSVSWLCRHRRGGLRASCSCLTHLSGSSTLSLRKSDTGHKKLISVVYMIHSTEVMTTGQSKPVGLTYNWTASGSALSSPQHTCAASTPQSWGRPRDTGETLPLGSQLSHRGSPAPDLLHLRPRPRLKAADYWGFLPLMHV